MNIAQRMRRWLARSLTPETALRAKYAAFRRLLDEDARCLELIAEVEEVAYGQVQADWSRVTARLTALAWHAESLVGALEDMDPASARGLRTRVQELCATVERAAAVEPARAGPPYVLTLEQALDAGLSMVGGKGFNLAKLAVGSGLPVPPARCVSVSAASAVLAQDGLRRRLDELLSRVRLDEPERLDELCAGMQAQVLSSALPDGVARELELAARELADEGAELLAVRSSAVGEDASATEDGIGGASFAGQYDTVLDVLPDDVQHAFLEVLASKYSPRAVAYRVRYGLADAETPMAVLLMSMVKAAVSGVVYTRDPSGLGPNARARLAVYAVPGQGQGLVDGSSVPDMYFFSRQTDPKLLRSVIQSRVQEGFAGRAQAVLTPAAALMLCQWGMALEDFFASPQDVEWCADTQGRFFVLQSRPMGEEADATESESGADDETVDAEVLFTGGIAASAGAGAGAVAHLLDMKDLRGVPSGAVVVTRTLPPELVSLLGRVSAVVAESGSRASHFASVAREFGLPVLCGAKGALKKLEPGRVVTLDTRRASVYAGVLHGLLNAESASGVPPHMARRVDVLKNAVSTLSLTDPQAPEFCAHGVQSLHDAVRYCHEKGVAAMFSLVDGRGASQARKLEADLPLDMFVLDLGGGLDADEHSALRPEHLAAPPARELWAGLTDESVVWDAGLKHMDWNRFDDISGGIGVDTSRELGSYVAVGEDYVHAMVRFGYHFAVVDALAGERDEANYAALRFKGGGADYGRRMLRLGVLAEVLGRAGFTVDLRGDLLDARYARGCIADTLVRVKLIGLLLGRTRLMDMALNNPAQAAAMSESLWSERVKEWLERRS